jgi:hypothetical protein
MTGNIFLDWAIIAVSLFNTILLIWLGLTVLLNAERRTWGIWLAGGGLLTGGAFFFSHTAILGQGVSYVSRGMNFWWHLGWGPVVISPFAWYVVVLWYAGFWDDRETPLRRRQRPWFLFTSLLVVALVGLLFFANPLPSYWQVAQLDLSAAPSVGGVPLLILVYPLYILLCIGLSLDALRHPGPSGRVMGDLARQRARPWLMAASVVLLLVSLLVAWVMLWIVLTARLARTGSRLVRDLHRQDVAPAWPLAALAQRRYPGRGIRRGGGRESGTPVTSRLQSIAEHALDGVLLCPVQLALLRRARAHYGPSASFCRQPTAL